MVEWPLYLEENLKKIIFKIFGKLPVKVAVNIAEYQWILSNASRIARQCNNRFQYHSKYKQTYIKYIYTTTSKHHLI